MKTWNAKPNELEKQWYVVDAEGKTLGRLSTLIADTLRGKTKPTYTPHVDTGDFVIVVNAEKVAVTGKKLDEKMYYRHSGYPGGLKERTLRQQLEKHRTQESCAGCHVRIDPPGFALESFDVMGGFRERYRAMGSGAAEAGIGRGGQKFAFSLALPVDSSGELADGRKFTDIREFKRLLLTDERQIARNLARQLVTYATGAPVRFSDRAAVERILDQAKPGGYGVRSLVHGIVQSGLFLNK